MCLRQPLPTPTDSLNGWLVSATGVKAAELTDTLGAEVLQARVKFFAAAAKSVWVTLIAQGDNAVAHMP